MVRVRECGRELARTMGQVARSEEAKDPQDKPEGFLVDGSALCQQAPII